MFHRFKRSEHTRWFDLIEFPSYGYGSEPGVTEEVEYSTPPDYFSELPRHRASPRTFTGQFPIKRDQKSIEKLLHCYKVSESYSEFISNMSPLDIEISLKTFLVKFARHLEWYDDNIKDKYMEGKEILYHSLKDGPSFNAEIADIWKYAQRRTFSDFNPDMDLKINSYPVLEGSLDYIFDPQSLIPWEVEDPKDYLLLFNKNNSQNIDYQPLIDDLRSLIGNYELPVEDELDMLKIFNTSKSFVPGLNKSKYNYEIMINKRPRLTSKFKFKRAYVWKNSVEARDCLVGDQDTTFTIMTCQQYLAQIGNLIPEYKMNRSSNECTNYLIRQNIGKYYYIMVDIKKCGLTYPRSYVLALLDFLSELYPQAKAFKCCADAYRSNPSVFVPDDGNTYSMTNGVGLGMLNELVTIGNLLIYRRAKSEDLFPPTTTGWFFNDDQLIFFESEHRSMYADKIMEEWITFLRNYGIVVHEDKPFAGKYGVFLEQWSRTPIKIEKSTRQYGILLKALLCHTICDAKEYFSQHYMKWWGLTKVDNENALQTIINYWGYEFDPQEYCVPYEVGGWVRFIQNKRNDLLLYITGELKGHCPPDFTKKLFLNKDFVLKYRPWVKVDNFASEYINLGDDNSDHWLHFIDQKIAALGLWTRNKKHYDTYLIELSKRNFYQRQKSAKSKTPSNSEIHYKIITKEWNNYSIPLSIVETGTQDISIPYIPHIIDIEHAKDPQRLIFSIEGVTGINPRDVKPSMVWPTWLNGSDFDSFKSNYYCFHGGYLRNLPILARFGGKSMDLYNDLVDRYGNGNFTLHYDLQNFKEYLSKYCSNTPGLPEQGVILPIYGHLLYVDNATLKRCNDIWTGENYEEVKSFIIRRIIDPQDQSTYSDSALKDVFQIASKERFKILKQKLCKKYIPANITQSDLEIQKHLVDNLKPQNEKVLEKEVLKPINLAPMLDDFDSYIRYQIQGYLRSGLSDHPQNDIQDQSNILDLGINLLDSEDADEGFSFLDFG